MPSINLSRNVSFARNHIKRALNLHGSCQIRTITVATDAAKYEDPELARAKPFSEIPAVRSFPFIGSAWIYLPVIGKYSVTKLHESDKHKNEVYGNIVREQFGPLSIVSCYTPEAMEVISKNEGKFPYRGDVTSIKKYREMRKHWYKSSGVIIEQGEKWWGLRAKTQKHLMKPKSVLYYLNPMQDVAKDLVKKIYGKRDSNKEVDGFLEDLYKWALESVANIGLDTRLGCLKPNLSADSDGMKLINAVQTQFATINELEAFNGNIQFWKYFPSPTWNKFVKASDVFTEIALKYINRSLDELKKNADEDKDLTMLQSMLLTKGLDVGGIMVMVADMLFAGIDTTSHSVGFLLYHLAKNPDKQKILAAEIRSLLPNKADKITPEIFNELHYLKSCMKESMRLHPIVRGNVRVLDKDVVIEGYRIPAETIILVLLQQVYRKEKYFKNANQFIPERWMNKDELPSPFAYLPFGFGTRSCIGRRLAELEMICLTVELLRNFEVEYHHGDIDIVTRLVNVPDKPLSFSFLDRK